MKTGRSDLFTKKDTDMRRVFLILAAATFVAAAPVIALANHEKSAKIVGVKVSDIPFEVAKQLLPKDKTITIDLTGVPDDLLRSILEKRGILTVEEGVLPHDLKIKLQAQQKIADVTTTLKQSAEWAEIGRAIGVATREGLAAITQETAKFADTTPGKFTMVMIAWKVMGADFLKTSKGFLIGIPLLITWILIFVWWLRRVYSWHRKKIVAYDKDGKKRVSYEEVEPLSVQWSKAGKDSEGYFALLAGVKAAAFVVVMFVIYWGI